MQETASKLQVYSIPVSNDQFCVNRRRSMPFRHPEPMGFASKVKVFSIPPLFISFFFFGRKSLPQSFSMTPMSGSFSPDLLSESPTVDKAL